eukprot:gene4743-3649_t
MAREGKTHMTDSYGWLRGPGSRLQSEHEVTFGYVAWGPGMASAIRREQLETKSRTKAALMGWARVGGLERNDETGEYRVQRGQLWPVNAPKRQQTRFDPTAAPADLPDSLRAIASSFGPAYPSPSASAPPPTDPAAAPARDRSRSRPRRSPSAPSPRRPAPVGAERAPRGYGDDVPAGY